ncbi:hypothetical protein Hanom_Chr00s000003g01604111 [Helianthus anomalus]
MRMRVPELNGHCMILLKAIFWFNKALFEIVELKVLAVYLSFYEFIYLLGGLKTSVLERFKEITFFCLQFK